MADLVLYSNPMSRGRIVRWMLEEVGQPYAYEAMDYANLKSPDYLAVNPMGKVPALRHGEVLVTEVAAICAYLADAFPQAGLAPAPASQDRAAYYRWLFFGAGPVEAAVSNHALGFIPSPERERTIGYGSYERVLDVLEQAVSATDYLAGGRFSAADLYVGSHIAWGMQFGTMDKRPGFEAYVARVTGRPAYARANTLDNALMPPAAA